MIPAPSARARRSAEVSPELLIAHDGPLGLPLMNWDEGAILELRLAFLPRDRLRPAQLDDVDLKIV